MNKIIKALLAILAGIDALMTIATPIILAALLMSFNNGDTFRTLLIWVIGIGATLFRAIKIGWMK